MKNKNSFLLKTLKHTDMKKNINFLFICTLLFLGSCADDDKLPVDFDDLKVSGAPYAEELSTGVVTNINKLDPNASSFSKEYQIVSPQGGTDVTKVDVLVNLNGENVDLPETLLYSVDASQFDTSSAVYPTVTVDFLGSDIVSALGVDTDDLEGGDIFNYRLALTNATGTFSDISSNFDNQSADHRFSSTVVCELPLFPPGVWTIELGDSFGDGWQTTTASGGPGITVTLTTGSNTEVFEITLESGSSGTETITVPDGTESAEWIFPGDFYGEISFTITAPSGNVVASVPTGAGSAGPIALNLCNE